MPTTQTLLGWVGLHIIVWILTFAFGDLLGGAADCSGFLCGTPLEQIVAGDTVLGREPSITDFFLVTILRDIIGALWGLFWFNYEILTAGSAHGEIHGLVGNMIRLIGILGSGSLVLMALTTLFQSRRLPI